MMCPFLKSERGLSVILKQLKYTHKKYMFIIMVQQVSVIHLHKLCVCVCFFVF